MSLRQPPAAENYRAPAIRFDVRTQQDAAESSARSGTSPMAYIILTANAEELDRLELTGPITIGRSPECDLPIRDILLSRRHCRIERAGKAWRITDLDSKNGTRLGWQKIATHYLGEGDSLRMGRTWLEYHAGAFAPAPAEKAKKSRMVRPADPFEALNGTVTDFVYRDPDQAPDDGEFTPSPEPLAPALAAGDGAACEGAQLQSGPWDSAVATVSRQPRLTRTMRVPFPVPSWKCRPAPPCAIGR